MNRREFLRTGCLAGFSGIFSGCDSTPSPTGRSKDLTDKPNIVLFFADDLGYADLGCCGSQEVISPHLDRMAREGIRLTGFYVASSVCTPSRSGLLTGRYPQRNGLFDLVRNNMTNFNHVYKELEYAVSPEGTQGLDVREITIAQVLKQAGYATGIFGKWDFGRAPQFMPLQRGFDTFFGFSNTGVDYWTHERYGMPSLFRGNQRIKAEGYATDLFKREALKFIETNRDRPFFLYVPFNAPHSGSNLADRRVQAPEKTIRMYGTPPGTKRQRYMAAITCMDAAIGEILDRLKALGLEDNTLVIFTSDNGGGDTSPLRGGKGKLYEGGIRVPFVATWRGKIPAGAVSDEFCSALDLFPSFLSLAGIRLMRGVTLDGFDMLDVLRGTGRSRRRECYWELRGSRAARVGRWKWVVPSKHYVIPEDQTGELYDLSVDIGEKTNLADQEPQVLNEMRRKWETWMKQMAESESRGPFYGAYFDKLGFGKGHYRVKEEVRFRTFAR